MDFNYTGSVQSKTLKPGTYTIECWGGQGGTYSSYIGGYGGYSKGTITLTEATTVYISVGGAGSSSSTAAGFMVEELVFLLVEWWRSYRCSYRSKFSIFKSYRSRRWRRSWCNKCQC